MTGLRADALAGLSAALPPGSLLTDPALMEPYLQDFARYPEVGRPLGVVRATSSGDVQAAVGWAAERAVPVVPRGAGSGLSGGATAVEGGIVLSLEAMREISISPEMRVAVAGAGALNVEVKRAAAAEGLWYPPDPSSFEMCSIGGNAATNAGGMCCVKYGVTSDYVLGLEVVLADGTLVRLGGPRLKDSAGLSLTKLFVGSEGTLGVITEVTLRLLPAPPPASTLVAAFATVEAAVTAVLGILRVLRPSTLELMDRVAINAVEDVTKMGLNRAAGALLIARSEGSGEVSVMEAACRAAGTSECYATDDEDEGEAFLAARRLALLALERKGSVLIEDVGVPVPKLPLLVETVERVARERETTISLIAHAGDGNTHPTIVYDASDPAASARARAAFGDVMEQAVALGGTITGEHGVGRFKQPWLEGYLGTEAMALSRRIKDALDPKGILNPGVMF